MNEMTQTLIVWVAAILLPLIPSVLLFKFLPSTGDATGPFKGLTFKFGGAFSGYLVLFWILIWIRPTETTHFHTWTISGQLAFAHPEGEDDPNVNDVYVRVIPPRLGIMNEGAFYWEIPVIETDGQLRFPDLQLDLRNYRGMTIPLGQGRLYGTQSLQADYDFKKRQIILKAPLTMQSLKQAPAYSPQKAEEAKRVK